MRVLVVDDEPEILLLVRANIEAVGHTCETAETANDAVRTLTTDAPPDVLLLDVAMPGLDGPALLADLRARGIEPRHVMLLSAIPPEELIELAVGLGVAWLSKPFTVDEFRQALRGLLDGVPGGN
ncbi:MAG TPA: response regulator [Acidimicrobiales bacterium]|jgi:CheY-like chemotaxis protein|nr:response regulator [Acidimicrobiales bacterium]